MSDVMTNRPDPTPDITARLTVDYQHIPTAIEDFAEAISHLPASVTSKEDHDLYVDLISKIKSTEKGTEAARVMEKDPYLRSERAVDGFFNQHKATLADQHNGLTRQVAAYLRRKEDEARRERERIAAEERKKAEELRRAEAERLRKAEEAVRAETKARHAAVADVLGKEADQQEAVASQAQRAAEVKPAELARTRSDQGTLSTLKSVWTFEVIDWDEVDLNSIRAYLKRDAIEHAIGQAVKIGVREMPGVHVFQTEKVQVR